jgi:thiol-disulfide isomerase/thioredoxin
MARTPSVMIPLGTLLPSFRLKDTTGALRGPDDFPDAKAFLILFICNHCPYVLHIRSGLVSFAKEYIPKGIGILAVNSNDPERYPADSYEAMKREVRKAGYPFPYLYDETQEVARQFQAACTPDIYLFDGARRLVYRGQFDGSRPGNDVPVTGEDLRAACDAVLEGREVSPQQRPSIGCNIKWKPGNEPPWFQ